ncbi:hypothetical protein C8Q72DRAFT_477079 [Fomitopsis betulina]|nr:hypothetical protein C8Q72DRAFT_477079 [Fomitopsis betulina]
MMMTRNLTHSTASRSHCVDDLFLSSSQFGAIIACQRQPNNGMRQFDAQARPYTRRSCRTTLQGGHPYHRRYRSSCQVDIAQSFHSARRCICQRIPSLRLKPWNKDTLKVAAPSRRPCHEYSPKISDPSEPCIFNSMAFIPQHGFYAALISFPAIKFTLP